MEGGELHQDDQVVASSATAAEPSASLDEYYILLTMTFAWLILTCATAAYVSNIRAFKARAKPLLLLWQQ
jgi:hypothetical protein